MVQRFLYLKPALIRLFAFANQHKLTPFVLTDDEWDLLVRVEKVLAIFVVPTKHLSGSKYPTIQLQLPYYSLLLKELGSMVAAEDENEHEGNQAISNACDSSWSLLNTYWNKSDQCTVLAIAMILDPRCKVEGLIALGWTPAAQRQAKAHFERVYQSKYAQSTVPDVAADLYDDNHPNPLAVLFQAGHIAQRNPQRPRKETTETSRWVEESRENWQMVPLAWWRQNGHRYPLGLEKMARDYLSIPASSVPAEQLFSRAGDIVTKKRNRLLDHETKMLLLVKNWLGQPDYEQWELELEERAEDNFD